MIVFRYAASFCAAAAVVWGFDSLSLGLAAIAYAILAGHR